MFKGIAVVMSEHDFWVTIALKGKSLKGRKENGHAEIGTAGSGWGSHECIWALERLWKFVG